MTEVWNLERIYKGFADPQWSADFAAMGKKVAEITAFAKTLLDPSGRILNLVSTKPIAIHIKSVSIGVKVAKKVVIVCLVFLFYTRHRA